MFGPPAERRRGLHATWARVCVDGRLSWREWETAEEQKRQGVSIVADSVQFMDPPGERAEGEDELVARAAGDGAAEPF